MGKPEYHVASFSGGKDSTAMLLGMLERGMHVDEIIFCDTGLEFPAMYEHIDKVERDIGRPITRLKPEHSFEYFFFEADRAARFPTTSQQYGDARGYSWASGRCRWCTEELKDKPRAKFFRELKARYKIIEYVGLAADEQYRLVRKRNKQKSHVHPLVDWNMTEAQCLKYCYQRGYDWNGLYKYYSRASCWCCPLQTLENLRQLYHHFPDLWATLKDWDNRTWRKFKEDYSVEELEARFRAEDERDAVQFKLF